MRRVLLMLTVGALVVTWLSVPALASAQGFSGFPPGDVFFPDFPDDGRCPPSICGGDEEFPGDEGERGPEQFAQNASPEAQENAQQAGAPVAQPECFEVIDPVTGEPDLVCIAD